MMFDACVIGHITKEIIRIRDKVEREMPGGTAYYSSMSLRSVGLNVAVITKMSRQDRDSLLYELEKTGITVFSRKSKETTVFENTYSGRKLNVRIQRVKAISSPFSPSDLGEVSARVFHIGPLTNRDVCPDLLKAVSMRGDLVSLDIQGLLREIEDSEVRIQDWQEKIEGLAYVDILKADEQEAAILSGEDNLKKAAITLSRLGPKEIIITSGSRGSLIFARGEFHKIPAFPPKKIIDPTGCGDTYMGGYIFRRLRSNDLGQAGTFAATLASLQIERFGALDGTELPRLFGPRD
jgi:sugar/nucleoside kinase (ribokinase family)